MKFDSKFIRQILLTIEEHEDYVMSSRTLLKQLEINTRSLERKFMGHILLLADDKLLESTSVKYPFGFVFGVDGEYSIIDVGYRLTARGYELIDIFRNEEVFEKVKNYSIDNALEISRQLLLKKATSKRKSFFGQKIYKNAILTMKLHRNNIELKEKGKGNL